MADKKGWQSWRRAAGGKLVEVKSPGGKSVVFWSTVVCSCSISFNLFTFTNTPQCFCKDVIGPYKRMWNTDDRLNYVSQKKKNVGTVMR